MYLGLKYLHVYRIEGRATIVTITLERSNQIIVLFIGCVTYVIQDRTGLLLNAIAVN